MTVPFRLSTSLAAFALAIGLVMPTPGAAQDLDGYEGSAADRVEENLARLGYVPAGMSGVMRLWSNPRAVAPCLGLTLEGETVRDAQVLSPTDCRARGGPDIAATPVPPAPAPAPGAAATPVPPPGPSPDTVAFRAALVPPIPAAPLDAELNLGAYRNALVSNVETDLRARGYRGSGEADRWSLWSAPGTAAPCLGLLVSGTMVEDAQSFGADDCESAAGAAGQAGPAGPTAASPMTAAVAPPATPGLVGADRIAALVGVTVLLHHARHHRLGQHLSGDAAEAEFERGYRDGRNGADSYNEDSHAAYADGYGAGSRERANRMEGGRYAYNVVRHGAVGPPPAARVACARRADGLFNLAPGSATAIAGASSGADTWQVAVAAGYAEATCTVSNAGDVRSINGGRGASQVLRLARALTSYTHIDIPMPWGI